MSAPKRIYLQGAADAPDFEAVESGITWCSHRIENDDVEYVRADKAAGIETLRNILRDIVTERLIPAEYPLLAARVRAALDGGRA